VWYGYQVPPKLKEFLQRWSINTVAVLIAAFTVPGIHYDNWQGLLIGTLVLSLLNVVIRPVLTFLSLPLVFVTFGLFIIVINAFLLYVVGRMKYFHVDTFGAACWGAVVIGIITIVLNSFTKTGSARVTVRRGNGKRPPPTDTGSGPVIDV
jgi:putative membrane protein